MRSVSMVVAIDVCPDLGRQLPAGEARLVFHAATRMHVPADRRAGFGIPDAGLTAAEKDGAAGGDQAGAVRAEGRRVDLAAVNERRGDRRPEGAQQDQLQLSPFIGIGVA